MNYKKYIAKYNIRFLLILDSFYLLMWLYAVVLTLCFNILIDDIRFVQTKYDFTFAFASKFEKKIGRTLRHQERRLIIKYWEKHSKRSCHGSGPRSYHGGPLE